MSHHEEYKLQSNTFSAISAICPQNFFVDIYGYKKLIYFNELNQLILFYILDDGSRLS